MINNSDKVYQDLLKKILSQGRVKRDRTGTGTISIPHASIEFNMAEGFPLLTTKKMFTKGIIYELLWFLQGNTNIQYLVKNGVNIWAPDAYREYSNKCSAHSEEWNEWMRDNGDGTLSMYTIDEFIEKIKTDDKFATKWGDLGPIYGSQWVDWRLLNKINPKNGEIFIGNQSINQIKEVMDKLLNKPDDRRMIVSAWNVGEIDDMALPPCHMDFHLYTEELTFEERHNIWSGEAYNSGQLSQFVQEQLEGAMDKDNVPKRRVSLIWDQRSVDTFLGLPFNIASYGILLHMFAQQANMVPDKLVGHLKNVHIYSNHVEQCREQISRDPLPLPKLRLTKAHDIFSYKYEDIKFVDYNPHPAIKGEISV